jgi:hypothetical protein
MTRTFRLDVVLAVTHHLPSSFNDYQEILEFISGAPVPGPSHSLGVDAACAQWLFEQHPRLREIPQCPQFNDETALLAWVAERAAQIGAAELLVSPMPDEQRAAIPDYMTRLLDHVDPNKVWNV